MKVNVTQVLKDFDGTELTEKDPVSENEVKITLRATIVNALKAPVKGENGMKQMEKAELAHKVFTEDEIDFNENDIALIKKRVGEYYPFPILVFNVFNIFKV